MLWSLSFKLSETDLNTTDKWVFSAFMFVVKYICVSKVIMQLVSRGSHKHKTVCQILLVVRPNYSKGGNIFFSFLLASSFFLLLFFLLLLLKCTFQWRTKSLIHCTLVQYPRYLLFVYFYLNCFKEIGIQIALSFPFASC